MSDAYLRPAWMPPDIYDDLVWDGAPAPRTTLPWDGTPPEMVPLIGGGTPPAVSPLAPTLPAPPVYQEPDLLSAPPMGFRERLAAALAGRPAYRPRVGTTGAQAFFGGLLSGAGRGFSNATIANSRAQEVERERTNTVRKAEADRNWSNAQATWREKLRAHYRAKVEPNTGRMILTAKMVEDARLPREAIGTAMNPKEYAERREKVAGIQPSGSPILPKPPKPAPAPKGDSAEEKRRKNIAGVVADLTNRGRGDQAGIRAYYAQPGVADTLARNGITLADLLRAVPE